MRTPCVGLPSPGRGTLMNTTRSLIALVAVVLAGLLASSVGPSAATAPTAIPAPAPAPGTDPNVWLVALDDATADDVAAMPAVQSLLADQGANFTNAYVPFPECCPSRATLLTGRYPHNHGVLDSRLPDGGFATFDDRATLGTWLDADYRTGLIGKYLNGYGSNGSSTYVPPGWDYWAAPFGGTDVFDYLDRTLNVNGTLTPFRNYYATALYGDLTREFLADAATGDEPFALLTNFIANHGGKPNEAGDPSLTSPYVHPDYQDTVLPSLPDDDSINEADVSDKPGYVSRREPLTRDRLAEIAEVHAQRQEALRSADEEIAATVEAMDAAGVLDSTYIVLMSDNGYMEGQHRISHGKSVPYQPAVRMPLIIRGPGIAPGTTVDALVGEPDIAPTILSLLGQTKAQTGPDLDGRNLLPLIQGTEQPTDRPILLEIGNVETDPGNKTLRGVVTPGGWKFVDYVTSGEDEMYDLRLDPYEQDNLYGSARFAQRGLQLRQLLDDYVDCAGRDCRGASSSRN